MKTKKLLQLIIIPATFMSGNFLAACAKTEGCAVECQPGFRCCDGLCVDINRDSNNCGNCGHNCGEGKICMNADCVEACGGVICSDAQSCCGDACVYIQTDPKNCGGCGNECSEGEICNNGTCEKITCDPECEEGYTCCQIGYEKKCIDLNSDPQNCGSCGNKCGLNETCKNGTCTEDTCDPACGEGLRCCGGTCVDTKTDPNNCGFCGNVCDPETSDSCVGGQCSCMGALECRSGQKCCPGIGCRNITSDTTNCGDCGIRCNMGESCIDGQCMCGSSPACAENEACCSGMCMDISSDPNNCGGCGITCGENGPDCLAGQCMCGSQPACPWGTGNPLADMMSCANANPGFWQKCCDGMCVPMTESNCGGCGIECSADQTCQGIYFLNCRFSCQ